MSEEKMVKMVTRVSKYADVVISGEAANRNMSKSRMIAIAIDHQLGRERPFEYDITLPSEKVCGDIDCVDECIKLLKYMENMRGVELETLVILRHDIGVPDKETFLVAFKICLESKSIEGFKPKTKRGAATLPADYICYRLSGHKTGRANKMAGKRYNTYLKLHKEFGEEA